MMAMLTWIVMAVTWVLVIATVINNRRTMAAIKRMRMALDEKEDADGKGTSEEHIREG